MNPILEILKNIFYSYQKYLLPHFTSDLYSYLVLISMNDGRLHHIQGSAMTFCFIRSKNANLNLS